MTFMVRQGYPTVFAREATGLVREVSAFEAFIFNLSASPLGPAIVYMIVGTTLFPGGDFILPAMLATIFSFFIAATYAQLTASFPRSGGDYVFNSRILHPAIGFGMNFSLTLWEWFIAGFYAFFVATSGVSPALVIIGYLTRSNVLINLGNTAGEPMLGFAIGTVVNLAFGILILTGTKNVFKVLSVIFILSLAGLIVSLGLVGSSSLSSFKLVFDRFASPWSSGGEAYQFAIDAAARAGFTPVLTGRLGLLPPMLAVASSELIWYFWSTYIAGEVRESNSVRKQTFAMVGAAAFNGILFVVAMWLILRSMGYNFLAATTYLGSSGSSSFPFISQVTPGNQVVIFISLFTSNSVLAVLLPILFAGWSLVIIPVLFLQPNRCVFSWAMDRIAPERFAKVSERYHAPIYTTILGMMTCEISLLILTLFPSYAYTIFAAGVIAPAFASIFPTALSAVLLPKRRKALFHLSGLDRRKVLGIPWVSVTGAIAASYLIFLTITFFSYPAFGLGSPIMVVASFGPIFIGIAIYYLAKAYRKKQGIDLGLAFVSIPPE